MATYAYANTLLYSVVDVFLISHTVIHCCFRKNANNGFTSFFSKAIINALGALAAVHLFIKLLIPS